MIIKDLIKNTVEKYFNMSKDERNFIENLLDDKKANWNKYELIICLLIYNKEKEKNPKELKELIDYIDNNFKIVINIINKFEIKFKTAIKV